MTTRRFWARPSAVALLATGFASPWPRVSIRSAAMLYSDRSVIPGTHAPYELGQRLAAGLPNAELVTIADADHGVMYFPGAAAALRTRLDRQQRAAA